MSAREDFWAFSIRIYGQDDVPPACLTLQNDYGLDVNLLLYCCWLGAHGQTLDTAALTRALAFGRPWSEHVVRPLRHARTWMKHDNSAREQLPPKVYAELRESIKRVELQAERLEQQVLEILADEPARASADGAASCASANLELYVTESGLTPDADMRAHLEKLVGASTRSDAKRTAQRVPTSRESDEDASGD